MPEPQNEQINNDEGLTGDVGMDQEADGVQAILDDAPIVDVNPSVIVPEKKEEAPAEPQSQSDENTEDTKPESTDGTPTDDSPKVKLGEVEYTQEQLLEAVKLSNNYNDWEKRLRSESQVVGKLTDEQIKMLVPYAKGQKEIPRDADPDVSLANEVMKTVFETETLTVKDSEGLDQEIPVSAIAPFIENVVKAVSGKYQPVIQDLEKTAIESRQEKVTSMVETFMAQKPEFKILVPEGKTLRTHINDIEETGERHPDHQTLNRFNALLEVMEVRGFSSLEETYNFMYGKSSADIQKAQAKGEAAEKLQDAILRNQEGATLETPGVVTELDDDDAFIESLGDSSASVLEEIGAA